MLCPHSHPKGNLFWLQDDTSNEESIGSGTASGSQELPRPRKRIKGKQRLAFEDAKGFPLVSAHSAYSESFDRETLAAAQTSP